jgi:hypothetical protein
MRPIGFSTGALAQGDVRKGWELQRRLGVTAVELSALRETELEPFIQTVPTLDLSEVSWISVHAPSRLREMSEARVVELLSRLPESWSLVVHPNVVQAPACWARLGRRMCIENMDQRKPLGRTASELEMLFHALPDAGFCLDLGHARQIDPTLGVAMGLLRSFGDRLRQIHISELDFESRHVPMGFGFRESVRRFMTIVDPEIPIIIESVVEGEGIARELDAVRELATTALPTAAAR